MNDALSIAQALIRCPSVAPLEAGALALPADRKNFLSERARPERPWDTSSI
jgi:hypothetical protein